MAQVRVIHAHSSHLAKFLTKGRVSSSAAQKPTLSRTMCRLPIGSESNNIDKARGAGKSLETLHTTNSNRAKGLDVRASLVVLVIFLPAKSFFLYLVTGAVLTITITPIC